MDEKMFSDLEEKIFKSFGKKDQAVYNEYLEMIKFNTFPESELFLSLSKVTMLIYGEPEFVTLPSRHLPRVDINAPIFDGMYPLHLAVLTSSQFLVHRLIGLYSVNGAKLDVKCCGDPNSPFYGLTPLEMALQVLRRNLIPWTPQLSVHELLSMFQGNEEVKSLMANISILAYITPRIRHLITEYALQGKVVELAALLKVESPYPIDFSTMYVPTADIPPELDFGVPMMLRFLVATRSASLIKEGIQLSACSSPEEYDNCKRKLEEMDCIATLLEFAGRGDHAFDEKQQSTVNIKLTDDSSEGSQDHNSITDESKVNTVAHRYLKNSLLYDESSKFQPPGIFNSLMPPRYVDRLKYHDGLDVRNCNSLAETFFRVLDGRKLDELSLRDTSRFRYSLEDCLEKKFKEAEVLMALEEKGPEKEAKKKRGFILGSSLLRGVTTALEPGAFYPVSKAHERLDVKKISTLVFSAVKKGKA